MRPHVSSDLVVSEAFIRGAGNRASFFAFLRAGLGEVARAAEGETGAAQESPQDIDKDSCERRWK